ncbi:MAG: hypothetical protein IJ433_09260 [Ruminococcus sp.]|nr:hypothetical protein [Ruminococcus sp.]
MSKKATKIIAVVAGLVIIAVAIAATVIMTNTVNISENVTAEIYYENVSDGLEIAATISEEDMGIIRKMVDSKKLYKDKEQSAKFDDKIYLSFVEKNKVKNFYISTNSVPQLKYKDKIVELEEWEIDQLYSIVGKYGAFLPLSRFS